MSEDRSSLWHFDFYSELPILDKIHGVPWICDRGHTGSLVLYQWPERARK